MKSKIKNHNPLEYNDHSVLIKKNYIENTEEQPLGKENTSLFFLVGTPRLQFGQLWVSAAASRKKNSP